MTAAKRPRHSDAIARLRDAYEAVVSEIERDSDAESAFERATELRTQLDRLVGEAAELRARTVARLWEAEELSLAALASRIGVSKGRASQFIQAAKAAEAAKQAGDDDV